MPDQESNEAVDRWQRWLQEEGARFSARAKDEETKAQIAEVIETFCRLVSRGELRNIEKTLEGLRRGCERLLNPPPPKGIDRFPIEGRSLGEQWRDLCLWLTVTAHQIIAETYSAKLKADIREQLQALTDETKLPHKLADLRSRVATFREAAAGWTRARMVTLMSRTPAQRESD